MPEPDTNSPRQRQEMLQPNSYTNPFSASLNEVSDHQVQPYGLLLSKYSASCVPFHNTHLCHELMPSSSARGYISGSPVFSGNTKTEPNSHFYVFRSSLSLFTTHAYRYSILAIWHAATEPDLAFFNDANTGKVQFSITEGPFSW